MSHKQSLMCLDVGEKRIGVALADSAVRLAVPFTTIEVDGHEVTTIAQLVVTQEIETLVVGYPRNQAGEPTAQTASVEAFAERLRDIASKLAFQDESLTSVLAEQRLASYKRPYQKADIDAEAAAIILQDYIEETLS